MDLAGRGHHYSLGNNNDNGSSDLWNGLCDSFDKAMKVSRRKAYSHGSACEGGINETNETILHTGWEGRAVTLAGEQVEGRFED